MEGPCADSGEKHAPASDPDTVMVDSLKALDPNRPIREATKMLRQRPLKLDVRTACSKDGETV